MRTAVPPALALRAVANYALRRPYCASFELTHNCNARCKHCHRGDTVEERPATPERLLEVCRELRPLVAIMSGGEPMLRKDLLTIVRTLKQGCAPIRIFINTNGALLTPARFHELCDAGVDEVLISLDYPDARHDEFRGIPGLFGKIRSLVMQLDPANRSRIVLTSVLHSRNYSVALDAARLALEWGVNINYSAYTWLRTDDRTLMIPPEQLGAFRATIEEVIAFKKAHRNVLTSDWVLRGMVRFYEKGRIDGCRGGERSLVVNPDGTLSPCGLLIRDYETHAALKREFTATNTCGDCYTSTRGNSERPARYLFLDHIDYLKRRAEA